MCYEKKYDKALEYLFKALEIDSELKSKPGISIDYELIGNLYKEIGNTFDAVNYYASSLKLKKEIGDKVGMADVHYALGTLYIRTAKENSKEIREKALKYIMVRRTRSTGRNSSSRWLMTLQGGRS